VKGLEGLPEIARRSLEDWRGAVKKVLRDKLVGIVVYGSAARGEYRDKTSDIDVALVLRGATAEDMRALRNPLRVGRAAARIEPMILDADEIARTAMVSPLFYDAIVRHRVVIQGKDPFAKLEIPTENVDLRIEQELRDARIRLRRLAVDASGESLRAAIERKLRQLREPFRALLEKEGVSVVDDGLDAVVQTACKHWNVPIREINAIDPDRAHAGLTLLVERAIESLAD
jgi:predicted nucleotidyltransferase